MNHTELMRKELSEAIAAGENALKSLYEAKAKLKSAGNWGLFDMIGGDLFSGLMKHSKINAAQNLMEQAKRDLLIFQRELRDVNVSLNLHMEVGSFLSFADFFFDGLIADYFVQRKIDEAREQVDDAIAYIEPLVENLKSRMY